MFFNVTPKTNAIDVPMEEEEKNQPKQEEIRKLRDSLGETGNDPYPNKMKKNATRRRNDDNKDKGKNASGRASFLYVQEALVLEG